MASLKKQNQTITGTKTMAKAKAKAKTEAPTQAHSQEHIDIVVAGFEAGQSDDEIIRAIFETGVSFKDLRPTFNSIVQSEGLRLSANERKELTAETLADWSPEDSASVTAKSEELAALLKVTESKALTAIRAWAKASDVDLPKPERAARVKKVGFGGYIRTLLDFALANRDVTRDGLAAHCKEVEIPEKYATLVFNIISFASEWNEEVVEAA